MPRFPISQPSFPQSPPLSFRLHTRMARAAFTLIELLTVIAIIGILAAIIIPTVGKVRESARGTRCISNLRSVGVAMALHLEDHKDTLPGPFTTGQGTPAVPNYPNAIYYLPKDPETCTEDQGKLLAVRLGPYMGFPKTGSGRHSELFLCPQLAAKNPVDSPTWVISGGIKADTGSLVVSTGVDMAYPFGYPNGKTPPKKLADILAYGLPPSRLWALVDCTVTAPGAPSTWGPTSPWKGLLGTPAHGRHSNALFFDWRVGKIDTDGVIR